MLCPQQHAKATHGNVKHHTPLGKETLKVYVLNKSNHQEKESYCEQQQAREGIRGVEIYPNTLQRPLIAFLLSLNGASAL